MTDPDRSLTRTLTIRNERGFHARPAARFVRLAETFDARIQVRKDDMEVVATSIMGLLMLGAGVDESITLVADGADAQAALEALGALVESGFGEGPAIRDP